MKKTLLSIMMILFSASIFAQGIYLRAGAGYGLPAASTRLGEKYQHNITNVVSFKETYSNEIVSGSYGSGMDFSISAGYEFNRNFLFDLNVQYLSGKKYETSNIYSNQGTTSTDVTRDITTTSSRGLYFNPALVFSVGFGKTAPYGRFGAVVASPKIISDESYYYNGDGIDTREIRWEYGKGLALGYQIGVGVNWKLTEKLDFFTEAGFVSMTYYAKEGDMTKNIQNGSDVLSQLPVAQKQVEYKKKYDPNLPYDPLKPNVSGRQASPMSSVSAQVGIRFLLWRKAE
ncbi:MAG: outer membrane beta-barrel protein [Bacteroidia bacterium]|nr:outer membrane beta-barrel protein [Bacteroidia bacterium]